MNHFNTFIERSNERGAGLVEYVLLLTLIALVCLGALAALGDTTGEPFLSAKSGLVD